MAKSGKRVKVFRWTVQKGWGGAFTLSANTARLAGRLYTLDKDITLKLTQVSPIYGLRDDPTDERVDFAILLADPDSLPNLDVVKADWADRIEWRSIGTDSGPVEIVHSPSDQEVDVTYSITADDDASVVCAIVIGSTTSSVQFIGVATFEVEYRQATYNNSENVSQEEADAWFLS